MKSDLNYDAHVFICTNHREKGESCGASGAQKLRDELKSLTAQNPNWKGRVRINNAGCLGHCERGIAAVIYPQNEWHVDLQSNACATLHSSLKKILD